MTHRSFDDPGSIEVRQHLLDNRTARRHPKRHRTRRRSAKLRAKKRASAAHAAATTLAAKRRHNAEVRAYWVEDREAHP